MHPQAAAIVKLIGNTQLADGSFLRPRIVTNGGKPFQDLLKDDEIVALLKNSRVAVSIEALDPILNDGFRGRGAAKNAWKTIQLLVKKGITVDVNCTVMRSTMDDAINLADRAYYEGVRRINFHSFSPIGRGSNQQHEALSPQEWAKFCDLMAAYKQALNEDDINDYVVDVEFAYDYGIPTGVSKTTCAIDEGSNLQFRPPQRGSKDCAVIACGLTMPDPGKSAYVFRNGKLFQRRGPNEHNLVAKPRTCCPLPFRQQPPGSPQPICIYTRLNHNLTIANAPHTPNTQWSILGDTALKRQ